ncbi:hypothetical protein N9P66_02245 [Salibacteraceae bacterium]|nr:hypothetical protein [Salibacteraceae bacterium]
MNKYSKLSRSQMIDVLNILHPDTVWKFNQELDNGDSGIMTEFLGEDTSCAQFSTLLKEEESLSFYYNMDDDWDTAEKEGKLMLEIKEGEIDKFLNQLNGVKEENNSSEIKDPRTIRIKHHYLNKGEEDKFTKTTEYQTNYISFKSDLVDSYVKSKNEFGIGSALINFSLLYRKKDDVDVCLVQIRIVYIILGDYFSNPNILKDLNIIFLADDEPVNISEQTAHDFGADAAIGFEETALLTIGVDNLIKICSAEKLEFRMSGSRGVFIEQEVDEFTKLSIKGFYNALFDQDYEIEYLIEGIKKEKAKKKEEERKEKAKKKEGERKEKEEERWLKQNESSPSSSSSNCFVVTATMGDANHPIVSDFRTFRDEHLLTNYFGKHFVSLYYKIGPYFASLIDKNIWLKKMTFEKFIKPIHKRITDVDE